MTAMDIRGSFDGNPVQQVVTFALRNHISPSALLVAAGVLEDELDMPECPADTKNPDAWEYTWITRDAATKLWTRHSWRPGKNIETVWVGNPFGNDFEAWGGSPYTRLTTELGFERFTHYAKGVASKSGWRSCTTDNLPFPIPTSELYRRPIQGD